MGAAEQHPVERTVMMLDALREIFENDEEIARALGVEPVQVSRWREGLSPADPAWDRLVDLFAVVLKLEGFYTPDRIRAWLGGPEAHLGDRHALFLIRHGKTGKVFSAIRALKAGTFA